MKPTLTRAELNAELAASNPNLRVADVEFIVTTIFDQITAALARGERVELRGFGAFTMRRRNAHIGRNPRTGELMSVTEKTKPFFKAGKEPRPAQSRWDEAEPRCHNCASAGRRGLSITAPAVTAAPASPVAAAAASSRRWCGRTPAPARCR